MLQKLKLQIRLSYMASILATFIPALTHYPLALLLRNGNFEPL